MIKRIGFFALAADFASVLADIESRHPIKYTLAGSLPVPEVQEWFSYKEIESLGIAEGAQASLCTSYLLTDRACHVRSRPVAQASGIPRFDTDQLINLESISFTPAGEWKNGIVLAGSFGTAYEAPASQTLMRLASSAIRRHFSRVRSYWLGPGALNALRAGKRLTIAEQSPPQYDLRKETDAASS